MRKHSLSLFLALIGLSLFGTGILLAQDTPATDCSAESLMSQAETLSAAYPLDSEDSAANLYRLGTAFQDLALACGYYPSEEEIDAQIERSLMIAPLARIIAVSAVGTDVDSVMIDLESVQGDSFEGQLLYNGIEPALDGAALGCVACHSLETAPPTESTYTRVVEIRLLEPQFADYDVTRYLVESILHPQAYIVPGYETVVMPTNLGTRLDLQQLANIVAYLESQDQLIEESE